MKTARLTRLMRVAQLLQALQALPARVIKHLPGREERFRIGREFQRKKEVR